MSTTFYIMLDQSPAFSSFSTDDIAKAKEFYGETLGLRVEETDEGLQLNLLGGGSVFIYPKGNHEPATFTVLNFSVDNIDEVVAELQKKGVTMEQYDMPGIQTDERGIARREG